MVKKLEEKMYEIIELINTGRLKEEDVFSEEYLGENEDSKDILFGLIEKGYTKCVYGAPAKIKNNEEVLLAILDRDETQLRNNYLFEDVVKNPDFVIKAMEITENKCLEYIPEVLKNDPEFVEQIIEKEPTSKSKVLDACYNIVENSDGTYKNIYPIAAVLNEIQESIMYTDKTENTFALLKENKEMQNDKQIMGMYVEANAEALKYASTELKEDYGFMQEQSKKNKEVIKYTVEHTEEFGSQGLDAAKDVTAEDGFTYMYEELGKEKTRLQEGLSNLSEEEKKTAEDRIKKLERDLRILDKYRGDPEKLKRFAKGFAALKTHNLDEKGNQFLGDYRTLREASKQKQLEGQESNKENENVYRIEPEAGDTIETLAKKIMLAKSKGNEVITSLNGFEIDSKNFDSAEALISGYTAFAKTKKADPVTEKAENDSDRTR